MSPSDHEHEWVQVGGSASAVIRCACGANLGAVAEVLDVAAEDVRSAAGVSYYTGCRIRSESEAVELWLFEAPAQLLGQLKALHPATYVIHNDAPRPETAVFKLMDALRADRLALKAEGIHVVGFGPTPGRISARCGDGRCADRAGEAGHDVRQQRRPRRVRRAGARLLSQTALTLPWASVL